MVKNPQFASCRSAALAILLADGSTKPKPAAVLAARSWSKLLLWLGVLLLQSQTPVPELLLLKCSFSLSHLFFSLPLGPPNFPTSDAKPPSPFQPVQLLESPSPGGLQFNLLPTTLVASDTSIRNLLCPSQKEPPISSSQQQRSSITTLLLSRSFYCGLSPTNTSPPTLSRI